jgi:hypothetical protein
MSITVETANELLSRIDTVEKLRDLISQLDVTGSGDVTVLYSGSDSWPVTPGPIPCVSTRPPWRISGSAVTVTI